MKEIVFQEKSRENHEIPSFFSENDCFHLSLKEGRTVFLHFGQFLWQISINLT